jgi:hypothetical protein
MEHCERQPPRTFLIAGKTPLVGRMPPAIYGFLAALTHADLSVLAVV